MIAPQPMAHVVGRRWCQLSPMSHDPCMLLRHVCRHEHRTQASFFSSYPITSAPVSVYKNSGAPRRAVFASSLRDETYTPGRLRNTVALALRGGLLGLSLCIGTHLVPNSLSCVHSAFRLVLDFAPSVEFPARVAALARSPGQHSNATKRRDGWVLSAAIVFWPCVYKRSAA